MAKAKHGKDEPTIIKKYANRRLYDTGRSSYVTLDDLCAMKMFTPFNAMKGASAAATGSSKEDKIQDLKKSIRDIEEEISRLAAE